MVKQIFLHKSKKLDNDDKIEFFTRIKKLDNDGNATDADAVNAPSMSVLMILEKMKETYCYNYLKEV